MAILVTTTIFPDIVSAHLCTVTFGFPDSKKNSFRGNYMRKYGNYIRMVADPLKPGSLANYGLVFSSVINFV